jgi:hypothetical protein
MLSWPNCGPCGSLREDAEQPGDMTRSRALSAFDSAVRLAPSVNLAAIAGHVFDLAVVAWMLTASLVAPDADV